jgi:hypothetical protein
MPTSSHLPLALCLSLLTALPACSSTDENSGAGGSGGNSTTLTVYPALFVEENTPPRLLADGDSIDLWKAPQGGHVLVISAQIEGVGGDTIKLQTRLRDPDTMAIVAEEGRTVVLQPVPGQDGRKEPDFRTRSQASHLPACPDYGTRDIVDQPYLLEVEVTELYVIPPRTGKATRKVIPGCAGSLTTDPDVCRCECTANYTLGRCK